MTLLQTREKMANHPEPLLKENDQRWVLFPIKYPDLYKMAKKAEAAIWHAEEIDLEPDVEQFKRLSDGERHYITVVLAFFAASDGLVLENCITNFYKEITWPEIKSFYSTQIFIENVHSEVYSQFIDRLIEDPVEKDKAFHGLQNYQCIKDKAKWAAQYMDPETYSLGKRLIGFACVEGIYFSASFAAIFYMKSKGKLLSLGLANSFIARDEGMHTDFAAYVYKNYVTNHLPEEEVHEIVRSAVEIEKAFVSQALSVELIGMNVQEATQYVEFIADRLLVSLGVRKMFHVSMPLDFMHSININTKTNFFESRVSQYAKFNVGKKKEQTLTFDTDF